MRRRLRMGMYSEIPGAVQLDEGLDPMTSAGFRPVSRVLAQGTTAALAGALTLGSVGLAEPASAAPAPTEARSVASAPAAASTSAARTALPPGRRIERYTVRAGDTATELAVRFHAWTAELIALNDLGPDAALYVGQQLRIPVVVAAERGAGERRTDERGAGQRRADERRTPRSTKQPVRKTHRQQGAKPSRTKAWRYADPSRTAVRRTIHRTALRHGVDPQLALAISWQEAGWQMHHVSSADAIGAMQVIPGTGTWMSLYAGRPLDLRRLRDNVLAGVLLLDLLEEQTGSRRHQVAAYYQGLGAVREHGLFDESKAYVANVLAIKRRLEAGRPPA